MAMKKSISRTLAHIDVAATVPFAFTKTFSTPTRIITTHLRLRLLVISGAVSRGRCNTGLQSIRRSFKSQCFSWPLIEAQGDLVQVRLRVAGQIRLLRQVLPQ